MKRKRYRVTRRGYIVFGSLGICLLVAMMMLVKPVLGSSFEKGEKKPIEGHQVSDVSDNKQTNQTNNASGGKRNQLISPKETNEILKQIQVTVYFKPDDYELRTSYYGDLSKIVDTSVRFKDARVLIVGHYNDKPNGVRTPFREQLAQNRAEVVEAYLVSQGVSPERIELINKGANEPVNQDNSWEEIQKNRRVVVTFQLVK